MKLSRRAVVAGGLGAAAVGGAAVYYAKARPGSKGKALDGLAVGAMAKLQVADPSEPAPAYAFQNPANAPATLADFRGQAVVLNLWAMWCAPCRIEMPTLAALARSVGDTVRVIAVNVDPGPVQQAGGRAFLAQHAPLTFYNDPKFQLPFELPGKGAMPQTVLIDRQGRLRAWLNGAADWSSPEALAVVEALAVL